MSHTPAELSSRLTGPGKIFIRTFSPPAGVGRGHGILEFQNQRDLDLVRGHSEYGLFLRCKTWQLAKWLMRRGVTSEAREEYFKLEIVSDQSHA